MKTPERLNLGDVLKKWRLMSDLGLRGAAKQIGVSASTLCRIENGAVRPDAEAFLKIITWLITPVETK